MDLDDHVARVLRDHAEAYPRATVMLPDITAGIPDRGQRPKIRAARLLFTDDGGGPISSQDWSRMWARWRVAAGWPEEGTFHSLRHHFATALISAGADPTDVQKALRHSGLRITLATYVHWWPKKQRRRSVMGEALAAVRAERAN